MIVAGMMSGTSCDGIDVAFAQLTQGNGTIRLCPIGDVEVDMPPVLRRQVHRAMAGEAMPALAFCQLDTELGQVFARALLTACSRLGLAPEQVDLVGSHGQTLWHWEERGRAHGTLQLGNPAWIAELSGISVVSDFRVRDVAAGGNGAPLVSIFDALLAAGLNLPGEGQHELPEDIGQAGNIGFVNLGGIANITVVPASDPGQHSPGAALAYDLGPANALIDAAMVRYSQGSLAYDHNGEMAARGRVDRSLMQRLKAHAYYRLPLPKSTGKETFSAASLDEVTAATTSKAAALAEEDVVATLTAHAASLVVEAVQRHALGTVVISGGGASNPVLRGFIDKALAAPRARDTADTPLHIRVIEMTEIGLPGGAKEAYAFAVLAYLTWHGMPGTLTACTGASRPVVLGNLTPGRLAIGQASGDKLPGNKPETGQYEPPEMPRRLLITDCRG